MSSTYANFTITVEPLKQVQSKKVESDLNLNEAFVKSTQDCLNKQKKSEEQSQQIEDSFNQNNTNYQEKISSQLTGFPASFNMIENLSCINESSLTCAVETSRIKTVNTFETISPISVSPVNDSRCVVLPTKTEIEQIKVVNLSHYFF